MRKEIIQKIIDERPDAVLVKNKYKVISGMIKRMFPEQYSKIDYKLWEDILYEAINADRDWRMLTEGKDKNKQILADEWKINNGYMPNQKLNI
jgi:hypothetical protein